MRCLILSHCHKSKVTQKILILQLQNQVYLVTLKVELNKMLQLMEHHLQQHLWQLQLRLQVLYQIQLQLQHFQVQPQH